MYLLQLCTEVIIEKIKVKSLNSNELNISLPRSQVMKTIKVVVNLDSLGPKGFIIALYLNGDVYTLEFVYLTLLVSGGGLPGPDFFIS